MAPSQTPGIFPLLKLGSEIFYEKILNLHEIGSRVDGFTSLLEKQNPTLKKEFYKFRQLSYALLHQALDKSSGKVMPIADFQVAADDNKIAFGVRFNATGENIQGWNILAASNPDQIWRNILGSAELIIFTELTKLAQVEVKAIISIGNEGEGGAGIILSTISDFNPTKEILESQRTFKFTQLKQIPAPALSAPAAPPSPSEHGNNSAESAGPMGTELNFKVKSDMLEAEKVNLQGLVKKKSVLIAELNKDVNRAQQEVIATQKNATKELLKMRMETEKAKNSSRDAIKKLAILQRRIAEKEAEEKAEKNTDGPADRDYEKDWKQSDIQRKNLEQKLEEANKKITRSDELFSRQRKDNGELMTELNTLKARIVKYEHAESLKEMSDSPAASSSGPLNSEESKDFPKVIKKHLADAKLKEQELEKEIKKLTLRMETAEKNSAAKTAQAQKQLEMSEKIVEESKRQKTLASAKIDELKAEIKKKVEENNSSERLLKVRIDEITEQLRLKTVELEKLTKKAA